MNKAGLESLTTNAVASQSSNRGMARSSDHVDKRFKMQRLSLDSAVAPLLPKVTAPFDRTERKRAHTSAVYYSECFLRGIKPLDADSAARDAQDQYDKWWIHRTARKEKKSHHGLESDSHDPSFAGMQKKRKRTSLDEASVKSTNVVSVASVTELMACPDDGEEHEDKVLSIKQISIFDTLKRGEIAAVKSRLINNLKSTGGDVESADFVECAGILEAYYKSKSWDGRGSCKATPFSLEGNWLTLSKPTYDECKGRNENGDLLYSLGRMSFGMFRPTNLVCSVQASFNTVRTIDPRNPGRPLHVPKKLMHEIQSGNIHLRTYDIVVAITIEPGQDRRGMPRSGDEGDYVLPKPMRGILTNQGYFIPDPNVPNRLSIWFSGGSLEVQDEPADLEEWRKVFDFESAPERNLREYANILAARLLLGAFLPERMEADGTMSFTLKKPIGGHGCAFCDIVYMDDDLRIMRGHLGSVIVCSRVPEPQHIYV